MPFPADPPLFDPDTAEPWPDMHDPWFDGTDLDPRTATPEEIQAAVELERGQ